MIKSDIYAPGGYAYSVDPAKIFALIFNKHQETLYRFAFKITRSADQASDIVQEVFISLWEHRDEIGDIRDMEAWLHRAAKNKLIDYIRKTAADQRLRDRLWSRLESSSSDTEHELDARELALRINQAIDKLPEKRRQVFRLNRNLGLSYDEVADHLSISRHTVKNQMSLALQSIQRFLSGAIGVILIRSII